MAEAKTKEIGRCFVSLLSTFITQFSLFLIASFFPDTSLLILLPLSVVVLLGLAVIGRCCKRMLRLRTSAPAFVFFNVIFYWGVYFGIVRKVITPGVDFLLNIEFLMLIVGLYRMLLIDPGYAANGSSHPASEIEGCDSMAYEFAAEECRGSAVLHRVQRVRYCTHCKAYVREYDHHCPAFGNCIGQNNHVLFMMLLIGFLCIEASYIACSLQYSAKSQILDKNGRTSTLSNNLAISTMLFSLLQVPWQGLFLAWHIYCVCFNIKTDEWINWKNYPEFHLIVDSEPGKIDHGSSIRFRNPYDKGIMQNLTKFLIKSYR